MKWTLESVHFITSYFQNNYAIYGADLASYPVTVRQVGDISSFELLSGNSLPQPLVFELIDEFGQIVSTAKKTQLTLQSNNLSEYGGTNHLLGTQGIYNFSVFPFFLTPGSTHTASLQILGTDSMLPLSTEISIPLTFRNCTNGEVYQPSQCVVCPVGMYSFNPDDGKCTMCPKHVACPGKFNFVVSEGYWRRSWNSSLVLLCPMKDICLGGDPPQCEEGYEGVLCTECSNGYNRVGTVLCVDCQSTGWVFFQFLLLTLSLLLYLAVIVHSIVTNNSIRISLIRLLLSHSQLLVIVIHLKVPLAGTIRNYLRFISLTAGLSLANLPYSCISSFPTVYISSIVSLIWPAATLLLVFIFLRCILSSRIFGQSYIALVPAILHLTVPATIEVLSSFLPYITLEDEEKLLFTDMREKYSQGSHQVYYSFVLIPGLTASALVVLALLLFAYFRGKNRSKDIYQIAQYKPKYWFWEPVVLLFKAASILNVRIAVFRLPLFQVTIFLLIDTCYLILYTALHPVVSGSLFLLTLCSGVLLFICYGGAYYSLELFSNASVFYQLFQYICIVVNSLFLLIIVVMILKGKLIQYSEPPPTAAIPNSHPTAFPVWRVYNVAVPNNSLDLSAEPLPHKTQ